MADIEVVGKKGYGGVRISIAALIGLQQPGRERVAADSKGTTDRQNAKKSPECRGKCLSSFSHLRTNGKRAKGGPHGTRNVEHLWEETQDVGEEVWRAS